jgi:hypothetical protein
MAVRDGSGHGAGCVVDVHYDALVSDPIGVARTIHEAAGLGWDRPTERALGDRLDATRQHQHGRHHYTPEQFGLDPDEVRARFRAYRARFGVT